VDERIILKSILNKFANRAWTELIWLRIETNGGLLNFSFGHKMKKFPE